MKRVYDYPEGFRHYDEGWNANIRDPKQALPESTHPDWWDGWNDATDADPADREEIS